MGIMLKQRPFSGWHTDFHTHITQKSFVFETPCNLFEFCFSLLTFPHEKNTQLAVLENEQTKKEAIVSICATCSDSELSKHIENVEHIYKKVTNL